MAGEEKSDLAAGLLTKEDLRVDIMAMMGITDRLEDHMAHLTDQVDRPGDLMDHPEDLMVHTDHTDQAPSQSLSLLII